MPYFAPSSPPTMMTAVPVTGDTVAMPAASADVVCILSPVTDIATLTVSLPDIPVGSQAHIVAMKNVALLSLTGFTVLNTVVAMTNGDCISLLRMAGGVFAHMV